MRIRPASCHLPGRTVRGRPQFHATSNGGACGVALTDCWLIAYRDTQSNLYSKPLAAGYSCPDRAADQSSSRFAGNYAEPLTLCCPHEYAASHANHGAYARADRNAYPRSDRDARSVRPFLHRNAAGPPIWDGGHYRDRCGLG